MSELGSGSGTSYPAAIDVDNSVEADGTTTARADVVNDLAAAIIGVQGELGTNPAGSLTDVKTFLQTQHAADGAHSAVTATTLSLSSSFTQKVGADVSSASALNVQIAGNIFDVTGTSGITSILTKGVGTVIVLQFDGIVVLTHHATNLMLGGSNITTEAGSVLSFVEYVSGKWRMISNSVVAAVVAIPAGVITLWSGAISAIPSGWVICDGNNSTPNLTAKFVIHASADSGATYDVNDTGGSTTTGASSLSIAQLAAHTHTYTAPGAVGNQENGSGAGAVESVSAGSTSGSTGSGSTHTHASTIPPYYALAYIMKS
jgi:hypothetical protein